MKLHPFAIAPMALVVCLSTVAPALADQEDGIEKVEDATQVFRSIMGDSDTRIPSSLLRTSDGIAIIPDVVQGGFFVGGRRGKGLMMVRQDDGSWSNPAFINLTGGSFGLQFGAKSSDIVLLFRDPEVIDDIMEGDFEFGVNASGTAGPVGDSAVDPTETTGDILSYSRSSGLFGGVALEGGELGLDDDRNEDFYERRNVSLGDIFHDTSLTPPGVVDDLHQALQDAE